MRYHHYATRTEETYVKWILDYIRFNGTLQAREAEIHRGIPNSDYPGSFYPPAGQLDTGFY